MMIFLAKLIDLKKNICFYQRFHFDFCKENEKDWEVELKVFLYNLSNTENTMVQIKALLKRWDNFSINQTTDPKNIFAGGERNLPEYINGLSQAEKQLNESKQTIEKFFKKFYNLDPAVLEPVKIV